MRPVRPLAFALSLAVGLLAGCGPSADDAKPNSITSPAATPSAPAKRVLVPHDPPQWFDARGQVPLPEAATKGRTNLAGQVRGGGEDLPVLLHEARAFVVSPTGVQVVDLADGRTVGEEAAGGQVLRQDSDGFVLPPVLAGSEVLVPFLLTVPASGTHTAGATVELVAVSTAPPHKAAWRTTVKLPEWALNSRTVQAAAVGAENGTAVVTVTGGDDAVSYGIDTAAHSVRWTQPGLETVQVGAGTAVGLHHLAPLTHAPLGVDLVTGTEKWRGGKTYAAIMNGAGPGTVRVTGPQVADKDDQLLDVTSGKARATMPPGMRAVDCTYDRIATLVCTRGFAVVAVDAATGTLLWSLKDGDAARTPPTVTTVWHGRIYGRGAGGPVVLDARTGADMPTKPEAAPLLVNEYVGLVLDDNHLFSYPAGG